MKKLTKAFFEKAIRENVSTGLNHFQAAAQLENEYEMYSTLIQKALTDVMIEDADFSGVNFG